MYNAKRKHSVQKSVLPNEIVELSIENSFVSELVPYTSSMNGIKNAAANRKFDPKHREILKKVLLEQYNGIKKSALVEKNIQSLSNSNTYTVTTGHQVCFIGGPLYFVIKLASVIKLAKQVATEIPDKNIVPVFWMATEDHDFEEANHVYIKNQIFRYNSSIAGAVGRMNSKETEEAFLSIKSVFPELSMSAFLMEVENAYLSSNTIAEATRKLANAWFGNEGLVCIDADNLELKQLFSPYIQKEIDQMFCYKQVPEAEKKMRERKLEPPVLARKLNLFYLNEGERVGIEFELDTFKIGNKEYTKEALLQEALEHPERMSPNVILRPLYQEVVLPNLAYVGGPAETKYWLQLTGIFKEAEVPYPVLVFRDNFLFMKEENYSFLEENNLEIDILWNEFDDLDKFWVDRKVVKDEEWHAKKQEIAENFASLVKLEGKGLKSKAYIPAAQKHVENIIAKLENRIYRDHKVELESDLKKWHKLKEEVFPMGVFQERIVSIFDVMGLMGEDPFKVFIENCDPFDARLKVLLWSSECSLNKEKQEN